MISGCDAYMIPRDAFGYIDEPLAHFAGRGADASNGWTKTCRSRPTLSTDPMSATLANGYGPAV
jgi:hypothetical protein